MSDSVAQIAPPSLYLAAAEVGRALAELACLPVAAPWLATAPRGDGHPVLVLPGFTAGDGSTVILRRFLKRLGYQVHGWKLGRNYDHVAIGRNGERLAARIEQIHRRSGQKLSLVGWSLGGVMAREAARNNPDAVLQVVSLGSPVGGDPRASNVWRFFEWVTGHKIDSAEALARVLSGRTPPPVPCTAIYSRTDGIVAWQNCLEDTGPQIENIEIHGSHCGLVVNPAALYAVADRLALPEEGWAPFQPEFWDAILYPAPARLH